MSSGEKLLESSLPITGSLSSEIDMMLAGRQSLAHKKRPKKNQRSRWNNLKFFVVGLLFGVILVKSEIISWFRIQEMFRLQSFHMYGVIGTAVIVGMLSVWLMKKFKVKTLSGEEIMYPVKKFDKGKIYGGLLFGLGWAMTGACPGPFFAQIGSGFVVVIVALLSAIAGTWFYGRIRNKLPH